MNDKLVPGGKSRDTAQKNKFPVAKIGNGTKDCKLFGYCSIQQLLTLVLTAASVISTILVIVN